MANTKTAKTAKAPKIPAEYTPISMWGYFGYELLFSIPVVGLILIIIFAISATNYNLKNFARSQFCMLIITAVLFAFLFATGVAAAFINELA